MPVGGLQERGLERRNRPGCRGQPSRFYTQESENKPCRGCAEDGSSHAAQPEPLERLFPSHTSRVVQPTFHVSLVSSMRRSPNLPCIPGPIGSAPEVAHSLFQTTQYTETSSNPALPPFAYALELPMRKPTDRNLRQPDPPWLETQPCCQQVSSQKLLNP